jgi:hypothetical protein
MFLVYLKIFAKEDSGKPLKIFMRIVVSLLRFEQGTFSSQVESGTS